MIIPSFKINIIHLGNLEKKADIIDQFKFANVFSDGPSVRLNVVIKTFSLASNAKMFFAHNLPFFQHFDVTSTLISYHKLKMLLSRRACS